MFKGDFGTFFLASFWFFLLDQISGGGEGFGRGTHYIQWGQGNLRFATMRLRGEKDENEKREKNNKILNYENIIKYDKIKILKNS